MTYPWEQLPAVQDVPEPPAVADPITLLQRDFAFAVQYTAVIVHSTHESLRILVNTRRGQIVPRGKVKYNNAYGSDPHEIEFQDVGMPQPNVPEMTVQELMAHVWRLTQELGLEIAL